jgi:hypothetical protein
MRVGTDDDGWRRVAGLTGTLALPPWLAIFEFGASPTGGDEGLDMHFL